MARTAENALGMVPTPFGPVRIRLEQISGSDREGFACRGPTLGLRWLFPDHKVSLVATRIIINPAKDSPAPVDLRQLFQDLRTIWTVRFRQDPTGAHVLHPAPATAEDTQPPAVVQTIKDLIAVANRQHRAQVRPSTLATYMAEQRMLLRFLPGSSPVTMITQGMVLDVLAAIRASGLSAETCKKLFVQMKRLLEQAVRAKLIPDNPAQGIKAPKVPRRLPRFLTTADRQRLLREAEIVSPDLLVVVALGTFLGLRKAEILAMTWKDIDLHGKVAQVANSDFFTTKNGRNRSVPISDALVAILLRFRRPEGLVVRPDNTYRLDLPPAQRPRYRWDFRAGFTKAVQAAGLDPDVVTPHVLRHTFASTLAQQGVSLFKIGEWMGHSMAEVTELYAHLLPYDADINRLSPPARDSTPISATG